jgi:hypothetical protein
VGDSRPITPGVSVSVWYGMKAGGRAPRKRTKENPFGLARHEKGKEEKRPFLFAPLRVEFDPIGWIGLPPEDTHSLRRALPSLPLMGAAA